MLRTRLTLKPGRPGTKRLLAEYGSKLICVRYRYDDERKTRCKTIELVVEEIAWPPAEPQPAFALSDTVHVRVAPGEVTLAQAIRGRGGEWRPESRTFALRYADALALRLTDRIVAETSMRSGA